MKNSGKIIFILNINGTETRHRHKKSHRQEYVPEVDVEECVSTGNPCGDGSIWPLSISTIVYKLRFEI